MKIYEIIYRDSPYRNFIKNRPHVRYYSFFAIAICHTHPPAAASRAGEA